MGYFGVSTGCDEELGNDADTKNGLLLPFRPFPCSGLDEGHLPYHVLRLWFGFHIP